MRNPKVKVKLKFTVIGQCNLLNPIPGGRFQGGSLNIPFQMYISATVNGWMIQQL